MSHDSPIVRKTNETPAKAKPTTYQIPSIAPFCGRAEPPASPIRGCRPVHVDPAGLG
jgi:hypothetical protein